MKILELELCSIGLHKHLKADLNTPTVGLMGPNGFGKTTVLEFLKFLFTGKMPEGQPQESFVTGWGKEGFPNNGTGRAVFIHHGQRGEIFRQVGKTAKRWLTWGNEKYTKAADVERVLDEIFGADREAMAKAIFIPQGEMDKLFFGSTAEREEMFVKIMLLSHLQTVVNVLDGKIKAISSGLQDLTFATDDIARQREASELTLADLERQLRSCRDWSPDSRALGTYKSLVASADAALAQFELNDRLSKEASQRLWEVLNQSDDLNLRAPDVTTLETRLTEARRSLQAVQSARVVQSAYRTTLKESKSLQSTIDAIKADIAAIEAEIDGLTIADKDATALQTSVTALRRWVQENTNVHSYQVTMQGAHAALQAFDKVPPTVTEDNVVLTEHHMEDLMSDLRTLDLRVSVCGAVGDAHVCPICESEVDSQKFSAEARDKLKELQTQVRQQVDTLRLGIMKDRATIDARNQKRSELAGAASSASQQYIAASGKLGAHPAGDLAALEAEVTAIQVAKSRRAQLQSTLATRRVTLDVNEKALAAIPVDQIEEATQKFDATKLENAETEIGEIETTIQRLEGRLALCRPEAESFKSSQDLAEFNRKEQARLCQEAEAQRAAFSPELVGLLAHPEDGPRAAEVLREKEAVVDGLRGQIQQATQHADGVRKRQHELDAQLERDAQKRSLLEVLRKFQATFARSGLPMRFIRHRFDQLAELTRKYLADMESNFTVAVDPERSVSFTFTIVDEADPYVMPQSKLSGGQKVRLSIAFLMAIQQLVVPEVSFLVLDEPSNHLDPEGKEQLKDLLTGLSERLQNSESQVWVCDHAVELEPAFGKVIRFGKK